LIFKYAHSKTDLKIFYKLGSDIYSQNLYYRASEEDTVRMIIEGPTHFHTHAKVLPFVVFQNNTPVCRFAFIHDQRLSDYIQVAFFEAKPGLNNLSEAIIVEAKKCFPQCNMICFGLNGHLNYGAGFLLNNFDKIPAFGLPYTMSYYKDYFAKLSIRKIASFSFSAKISDEFHKLYKRLNPDKNISIKNLDKSNLSEFIKAYTQLNNTCFQEHPYWADRDFKEDLEQFDSFKHLIKNENLIFAEYKGKLVGFLLWFPDFNQLLSKNRELKANYRFSLDVLRFKLLKPINTFRFTEIAVDPDYRKKGVEMVLINQLLKNVSSSGYKNGVGGFIFEENLDSINMTIKYIERITGEKFKKDSEYAIFETSLK